jgi:uncharacterized protein YqjF (DUF2071 family)
VSIGFEAAILQETAHRPWPPPQQAWMMVQTWLDLLFAHWPIDARLLRSKVPSALTLDLFENQAYLGVVPFTMTNVTLRGIPPLPYLSTFPELNVRTYVTAEGKPGVFFFSLDAANAVAVRMARLWLNLPYYWASMTSADRNGTIDYRSSRHDGPAELVASYVPTGPAFAPEPGSFDYFLTERYCLYAVDRSARPYRLEIHHRPWNLQPAQARFEHNSMAAAAGLTLPDASPILHFSKRQDMVAWGPTRIHA